MFLQNSEWILWTFFEHQFYDVPWDLQIFECIFNLGTWPPKIIELLLVYFHANCLCWPIPSLQQVDPIRLVNVPSVSWLYMVVWYLVSRCLIGDILTYIYIAKFLLFQSWWKKNDVCWLSPKFLFFVKSSTFISFKIPHDRLPDLCGQKALLGCFNPYVDERMWNHVNIPLLDG